MIEEDPTKADHVSEALQSVFRNETSPPQTPQHGKSALQFPPTRWSLVLEAAEGDEDRAQEAMRELCEHYIPTFRKYFLMKCRENHDAEDLASKFKLHLLEKNRLRKFERQEKKRFRNYLSRALKFFLYDHLPDPPAEDSEPQLRIVGQEPEFEKEIDASFALVVHERAILALETSYARLDKKDRFDRLHRFLLTEPEGDDYQQAASDLGLSLNTLYQVVYRLRHDYYEKFRSEVAQTVQQQREELEEETRYLLGLVPSAASQAGS